MKIDIPRLLVHLRARSVEAAKHKGPSLESTAMAAAGAVFSSKERLAVAERIASWLSRPLATRGVTGPLPGPLRRWTVSRDAPLPPRQSFRDWWRSEHGPALPDEAKQRTVQLAPAKRRHAPPVSRTGREGVLGAVRASLRSAPFGRVEVLRGYRGQSEPGRVPPVELFMERLSEYKATATLAAESDVRASVEAVLDRQGSKRVVVPAGLPEAWRPAAPVVVEPDSGQLSPAELDGYDACVTGCAVAVAETGTVVLDSGESQGRRAISLVPDHLVVVVREEQVVAGVPDAIARLISSPVQTWISGPSATSDIELNRVEGVHGPRKLDVVVLSAG